MPRRAHRKIFGPNQIRKELEAESERDVWQNILCSGHGGNLS